MSVFVLLALATRLLNSKKQTQLKQTIWDMTFYDLIKLLFKLYVLLPLFLRPDSTFYLLYLVIRILKTASSLFSPPLFVE